MINPPLQGEVARAGATEGCRRLRWSPSSQDAVERGMVDRAARQVEAQEG